jgi:hypothetical protein
VSAQLNALSSVRRTLASEIFDARLFRPASLDYADRTRGVTTLPRAIRTDSRKV